MHLQIVHVKKKQGRRTCTSSTNKKEGTHDERKAAAYGVARGQSREKRSQNDSTSTKTDGRKDKRKKMLEMHATETRVKM